MVDSGHGGMCKTLAERRASPSGIVPADVLVEGYFNGGHGLRQKLASGASLVMSQRRFQALEFAYPGKVLRILQRAPVSFESVWRPYRGVAVHVLSCVETATGADGVAATTTFMWVSDMPPSREGLAKMANKAGRQRWKIENQGFNTQKNHGYNIEHGFGVTGHTWKSYYLIAQMVHIIGQMTVKAEASHKLPSRRADKKPGSPPPLLAVFGSLKNVAKRLGETFRYCPPTWRDFQLRFVDGV